MTKWLLCPRGQLKEIMKPVRLKFMWLTPANSMIYKKKKKKKKNQNLSKNEPVT